MVRNPEMQDVRDTVCLMMVIEACLVYSNLGFHKKEYDKNFLSTNSFFVSLVYMH